jgi:hypothetical protein
LAKTDRTTNGSCEPPSGFVAVVVIQPHLLDEAGSIRGRGFALLFLDVIIARNQTELLYCSASSSDPQAASV